MNRVIRARTLGIAVIIIALALLAFLAGRYSVGSIASIGEAGSGAGKEATWKVQEEAIGRAVAMNFTLNRSSALAPTIRQEGVVTSCNVDSRMSVSEGNRLVDINLSPIIAGHGSVPAFRDLEEGMQGDDVLQLRSFLCRQGYQVCASNSTFTPALSDAVRAWQKKSGFEVTGVVKAGDIMWFSSLPTVLSPEAGCTVGANVDGNSHLFRVSSSTPVMSVGISEEQISLFAQGNTVIFDSGEKGILGEFVDHGQTEEDSGQAQKNVYLAEVLSEDGTQQFCNANTHMCDEAMGGKDKASVIAKIENMPEQRGIGVPIVAIQINARGDTYVLDESKNEIPIKVINSDSSIALVEGLEVGTVILLHGEAPSE